MPRRAAERASADIDRLAERLRTAAAGTGRREELRKLVLEEISGSTRLAGAALNPAEQRALIERGVALGEHALNDYLIVSGYAEAATWVAAQTPVPPGRGRAYLRLEEIADLHARVTAPLRRTTGSRPRDGSPFRSTTHPFDDGMMPPPPWLVSFELNAFVERFVHGLPPNGLPALWAADALERFMRIQPFAMANGRMGRLLANLLLRRLDLPPFSVAVRDVAKFRAALRRADSNDQWPLAALIARSVSAGLARLLSATDPEERLERLAALTQPAERSALYKAAQRGRLRTIRRGGELLTTRAWLEAYRASRA